MKRNELISILERHGLPDDEIEISVEAHDTSPIPFCTADVMGFVFTSGPDGANRCIHLICGLKEDFTSMHQTQQQET